MASPGPIGESEEQNLKVLDQNGQPLKAATGNNGAHADVLPGAVAVKGDVEMAQREPSLPPPGTPVAPEPPAAPGAPESDAGETYISVTYFDILKHFSLMGYIGFGGPAAHIGR
ncbi:hypothetical protein CHLRE_12g507333v5 [Chlamydomonas reinhardtii]|uniref:Uncharacterized protein n=1 Tax=Chlamydomonas reinhardtii TaxID=3055 RepID=A0A2K3D3L8_CHLRE|nr:uncharacterized protein CHLRE_12g507333v5 [Chlamydomonas reinhardtii]PNW75111.1 hypothetical protein CHLRE_12g507333v5 [Chlamydomonas reinhardtii]